MVSGSNGDTMPTQQLPDFEPPRPTPPVAQPPSLPPQVEPRSQPFAAIANAVLVALVLVRVGAAAVGIVTF